MALLSYAFEAARTAICLFQITKSNICRNLGLSEFWQSIFGHQPVMVFSKTITAHKIQTGSSHMKGPRILSSEEVVFSRRIGILTRSQLARYRPSAKIHWTGLHETRSIWRLRACRMFNWD
uniref:Uncharacterized protein n=1 Tax=Zea mays TaxID=4577 RepID=A0A804M482_MAIZE